MLKTGDKVVIKSSGEIESEIKKSGYSPGFFPPMDTYCGKETTIVKKFDDVNYSPEYNWFYLGIDDQNWVWNENWLEKISAIQLNDNLFEL